MPPLTMRGRYLMREYWTDSDLFLKLTAEQREVYVGLWTLADDEGWLPRDIPAIAAALFRYEDRRPREERVRSALDRLRVIGKLRSYRCGCIHLPSVERYPRAGRKSSDHAIEHRMHLNGTDDHSNPSPDLTYTRPYETLPDGSRAREREAAPRDGSEFRRRVPRDQALGTKETRRGKS